MLYFSHFIFEGTSFAAKKFTFFVNDDLKAGKKLAPVSVQTRNGSSPVIYSIDPTQLLDVISIDKLSGVTKLQKDLKTFIGLRRDGTRRLSFNVTGCQTFDSGEKSCAAVNVFIIALRRDFGDRFVEEALKHVTSEKLVNHIFKGVTSTTISPSFLLRILRRVPKTSEDITLLEAKQEMLLNYIKRKIVHEFSFCKL